MADHLDTHVDHGDGIYWKTFIALCLMTGVEVFMYFESVHELSDNAIRIILVLLMVVKLFVVGAVFMHLKDDDNVFTTLFTAGLVIAYPVYWITAFAFGVFPGWDWYWKVIMVVVPTIIVGMWLYATRRENAVDPNPLSPIGH